MKILDRYIVSKYLGTIINQNKNLNTKLEIIQIFVLLGVIVKYRSAKI